MRPLTSKTSRLAFLLLLLLDACASETRSRVTYQRLLDMSEANERQPGSLRNAVVRSASPFEVRDVSIHGDQRPSLVLETPARVAFRAEIREGAELRFGLAVRLPETPVEIALSRQSGEILYQETWKEQRDWVERRIDLSALAGQSVDLELTVSGPPATVMLGHPELVGSPLQSEEERPNVIVYVVDCLRADHVGAYGYGLPTTPSLDELAKDSLVLEELVSCAPWTKPSTGCLFTSLLPMYHQARTIDDALSFERMTLAEVFRDAGYATAAWVANPVINPRVFFFNQGFDRWIDLRTFEARSQGAHINALESDAADITEGVLPWLEANRERSFFLYLHSLDLHYGYRPRPPFDAVFVKTSTEGLDRDRELYDNELAYNDREIGKLVATLQSLGIYDKTLVFVTADHGEEFGEHGFTRHGKTLFRDALHIPGILKLPGSRYAGRRLPMLHGNIDVAPTLLELTGLSIPDVFQGRSIALNGEVEESRRVFAELVAPQYVSYAVHGDRYKYIRELLPEPREHLFDRQKDPAERSNLLPSPASLAEDAGELVAELDRVVQLSQHGLHVSLRGKEPGTRVMVEAVSDAEIASAFRFPIVTGDLLDIDDERKRLALTFTADDSTRHLVIQTRPEGALVRFNLFVDGAALTTETVSLGTPGADGAQAISVPFTVTPRDVTVSLEQAAELLHVEDDLVRVWQLPLGAGRNRVELDQEMQDTLRALGYIQ
ncbi:MAG: sulfatase [Vicinamibacteria bacterium]